MADIYTEQSDRRSDPNTGGVEIGVRHQLNQRLVLDAGAGTEFAGTSDKAEDFSTAGPALAS